MYMYTQFFSVGGHESYSLEAFREGLNAIQLDSTACCIFTIDTTLLQNGKAWEAMYVIQAG